MKFLLFDSDSSSARVVPIKPPEYTFSAAHKDIKSISIWFSDETHRNDATRTLDLIITSIGRPELIREARYVADKLCVRFPAAGFMALGASPKIVKWALQTKGAITTTINASRIKVGVAMTLDFKTYLKRKLQKLAGKQQIIVMDYADSGASLFKIKQDVLACCEEMPVFQGTVIATTAVGASDVLEKGCNATYKGDIDYIFTEEEIPTLRQLLYTQSLKAIIGRAKNKMEYENWKESERTRGEGFGSYSYNRTVYRQILSLPDQLITTEDFNSLFPETDSDDDDFSFDSDDDTGATK